MLRHINLRLRLFLSIAISVTIVLSLDYERGVLFAAELDINVALFLFDKGQSDHFLTILTADKNRLRRVDTYRSDRSTDLQVANLSQALGLEGKEVAG